MSGTGNEFVFSNNLGIPKYFGILGMGMKIRGNGNAHVWHITSQNETKSAKIRLKKIVKFAQEERKKLMIN